MGPLSPFLELHGLTAGWSTVAVVTVLLSAVMVGRAVMLGDIGSGWIHEHPIAIAIGAAIATSLVIAALAWMLQLAFGIAWPALPIGLAVAALCGHLMSRNGTTRS